MESLHWQEDYELKSIMPIKEVVIPSLSTGIFARVKLKIGYFLYTNYGAPSQNFFTVFDCKSVQIHKQALRDYNINLHSFVLQS